MLASILNTQYPVVKSVLSVDYQFRLTTDDEADCDVFWWDGAVPAEKLSKMKLYQKINHFPGMYELARKNNLGKNLNRMRKLFPAEYNFYPKTWMLPSDWVDFASQFTKRQNKTFIVKPEASCQGRGIFLTRRLEDVSRDERYVAQRYMHRPFLIDGLKFDLRIYVLVAGCDPMRIYLHKEGLARFATEPYSPPVSTNLGDPCMHLTNYAVNKLNPNFVFNEDVKAADVGHKRSLTSTLKMLQDEGRDVEALWKQIGRIIVKTLLVAQPTLSHVYRSCQPDDHTNSMCFEILGFDIILDHKLKPHVLEVNQSPSFTTDSPMDLAIKTAVIGEAVKLMNVTPKLRVKYFTKKRAELQQRAVNGRTRETKEAREANTRKAQRKRDKYEDLNLGGYSKIYPGEDAEYYTRFFEAALEASRVRPLVKNASPAKEEIKVSTKLTPSRFVIRNIVKREQSKSEVIVPSSAETDGEASVFERLNRQPEQRKVKTPPSILPFVKFDEFVPLKGDFSVVPSMPASLPSAMRHETSYRRQTLMNKRELGKPLHPEKGRKANYLSNHTVNLSLVVKRQEDSRDKGTPTQPSRQEFRSNLPVKRKSASRQM
jgi:tubulin polyglutamylase TTLL6/13